MIRKPTSGDSDQREREAERARKHSQLSAGGALQSTSESQGKIKNETGPAHGGSPGESAHGAIPRKGIEFEHGD